uniref:Protein tyrosine phosphatase non-receptor type 20 n=1 Tax=Rousettus aegyptiacus TaxID=9407 RepID=A0A7J8GEW4_ROUAE|nr:protein tyrosine phosphatase non-receptor type 20 [Rousettus aegyptiacus]
MPSLLAHFYEGTFGIEKLSYLPGELPDTSIFHHPNISSCEEVYWKSSHCKTVAVHQLARPRHSCFSRWFYKICSLREEEPPYRTHHCSLQCWCGPDRGVPMCGCCVQCH